jgi:hypothetical protein
MTFITLVGENVIAAASLVVAKAWVVLKVFLQVKKCLISIIPIPYKLTPPPSLLIFPHP